MAIYESERRGNGWVDLPLGTAESLVEVLRREGKIVVRDVSKPSFSEKSVSLRIDLNQ